MSSFSALLASVGGNKQPDRQQPPAVPTAYGANPAARKPQPQTNGAVSQQNGAKAPQNRVRPVVYSPEPAAPLKRKAEEQTGPPATKTPKTEQNAAPGGPPPARQTPIPPNAKPVEPNSASDRPMACRSATNAPYRGTARPSASSNIPNSSPNQISKPSRLTNGNESATPTPPQPVNGASKPKKGFASLLERAKAAQEAAKAAPSTIVHKPAEKLTKRERHRIRQEALEKEKATIRNGKSAVAGLGVADRSRSGTPADGKCKAQPMGYTGTRKKFVERVNYSGTMRAAPPGEARKPSGQARKKDLGQDKYGGYASWSDLDDAEGEDEGDYGDGSDSDMEGGFDDVEHEEQLALRVARKEDHEALEEEERLKREKLVRKKKLMALSKGAAAKKRF